MVEDMKKMKPLLSMAIKKVKIEKPDKMSFEDEGLRASAEEMMDALKGYHMAGDEDQDVKDVKVDRFIDGLCSFLEMKYGLEPKEEEKDEEEEKEEY